MLEQYNLINTPQELLRFMQKNFHYGYIDKSNHAHLKFDSNWFNNYTLQIKDDMLKSKIGCCFDAVEFARNWFLLHNYKIKTVFEMVRLDYVNNYPMHTFLVYQNKNLWYYFEWADEENSGIYQFLTLDESLDFSYKLYLKHLINMGITNEEKEKIIRTIYSEPKKRYNAKSYIIFVQSGISLRTKERKENI